MSEPLAPEHGATNRRSNFPTPRDTPALLLRVAWAAVLLGFAMQALVAVAAWLAHEQPALKEFCSEGAGRVAWSTFVCVGLAAGAVVSQLRAAWVGAFGLLAAPFAFVVARTTQKSTATAFDLAPPAELGPGVFIAIIALKAVEYALLGSLLVWMSRRDTATLRAVLGVGLAIGVVFGGAAVLVLSSSAAAAGKPMAAPRVVSQLVNELLFPVGCALVLFVTNVVGRRMAPTV